MVPDNQTMVQRGGSVKERWLEFCELAAKEQDPKKLLLLVEEINRLLEEKEQRFKKNRQANPNK
jgi:hypothetical protein